jgi:hypothetical protein
VPDLKFFLFQRLAGNTERRSGRAFNFIRFLPDLQVACAFIQRDSACDLMHSTAWPAPSFLRGEKDIQPLARIQPLLRTHPKKSFVARFSQYFPA